MARDFNGSSDFLQGSFVPVIGYPFTMACWFNSDSDSVSQYLMHLGDISETAVYCSLTASGSVDGDPVRAIARTAATLEIAATTSGYTPGKWHHACGRFISDTNRSAFIDGGSEGGNTNESLFDAGIDTTAIGRLSRPSPAAYTDGKIAHAGIWNITLSREDVKKLAAGWHPRSVKGKHLVAYWEIKGAGEIEKSEVSNHALIPTGTTYAPFQKVLHAFPPAKKKTREGLIFVRPSLFTNHAIIPLRKVLYRKPPVGVRINKAHYSNKGLLGYFLLNEGAGSRAVDLSGNNDAFIPSTSMWSVGKTGRQLTFNGSSNYVAVTEAIPTSYPFTVECWVRSDDTADTFRTFYSCGNTGEDNYFIILGFRRYTTDGPGVRFTIRGASGQTVVINGSITVQDGKWHHVVGVAKSATELSLYVDGVSDGSPTGDASAFPILSIGRLGKLERTTSDQYFPGDMSLCKIYSRECLAAEIKALSIHKFQTLYRAPQLLPTYLVPETVYSVVPLVNSWLRTPPPAMQAKANTAHILYKGLRGRWLLNEGHGTVVNNLRGGMQDRGDFVNSPTWLPTNQGHAIKFDGSTNYVNTNKTLGWFRDSFTYSIWFRTTANDTNTKDLMCSIANAANKDAAVLILNGNGDLDKISFWVRDDAGIGATAIDTDASGYFDGEWHHLCGVFAGQTAYLYIDGELRGSQYSPTIDTIWVREPISLGCRTVDGTPSLYFPGDLRDASLYNYNISPELIALISKRPYQGLFPKRKLLILETTSGVIVLSVNDALHGHTVDNVVLTQANTLAVQEANHAHTADNIALIQANVLVVQEAAHGHTVDNIVLVQQNILAIAEALHAHTVDNIDLTQANVLAVNDALHGHTADNIDLITAILLVVSDALHSHTVDNIALIQAHVLAVNEALHGHTADNIDLIQAHVLAMQDALHSHTADNIDLDVGITLEVQETTHGHTAENLDLIQANLLAIDDALHSHTVDNIDLTQASILTMQDALHGHTVDNIDLDVSVVLDISDAAHAHLVDNIDLVQANILAVLDSLHGHTADNIDLLTDITLIVSDALHQHLVDNIDLSTGVVTAITPEGRIIYVMAEDRIIYIY